jgi:hypothetical protein
MTVPEHGYSSGLKIALIVALAFYLETPNLSFAQTECTVGSPGCTIIPPGQQATIQTGFSDMGAQACEVVTNNCLDGDTGNGLMVPYVYEDEWKSFLNSNIITGANQTPVCATLAPCNNITVSLEANPTSIITGQSMTLSWKVKNYTGTISCVPDSSDASWPTAGHPNPNPITSTSGNDSVTPISTNGTVFYTLICTDSAGNQGMGSASITVYPNGNGGGGSCAPVDEGFSGSCGYNIGRGDACNYGGYVGTSAYQDIINIDTASNIVSTTDGTLSPLFNYIWEGIACSLPDDNDKVICSDFKNQPPSVWQPFVNSQMAGDTPISQSGILNGSIVDGNGTVWNTYGTVNWQWRIRSCTNDEHGHESCNGISVTIKRACGTSGCNGSPYPDIWLPEIKNGVYVTCPASSPVGQACAVPSGHGNNDHGVPCIWWGHYSCQTDGTWKYGGVTCLDE